MENSGIFQDNDSVEVCHENPRSERWDGASDWKLYQELFTILGAGFESAKADTFHFRIHAHPHGVMLEVRQHSGMIITHEGMADIPYPRNGMRGDCVFKMHREHFGVMQRSLSC